MNIKTISARINLDPSDNEYKLSLGFFNGQYHYNRFLSISPKDIDNGTGIELDLDNPTYVTGSKLPHYPEKVLSFDEVVEDNEN